MKSLFPKPGLLSLVFPSFLSNIQSFFQGVEEEKAPIYDYPQQGEPYEMQKKPEFESFLQALSALNLPQKKPEGKKGASSSTTSSKDSKPGSKKQMTTNFNPSNPFHMIEKIDLSNFAGKVISSKRHSLISLEIYSSFNERIC